MARFEGLDLTQHYPHGDVVMSPPSFDISIFESLPTAHTYPHSGKGRASAADVSISNSVRSELGHGSIRTLAFAHPICVHGFVPHHLSGFHGRSCGVLRAGDGLRGGRTLRAVGDQLVTLTGSDRHATEGRLPSALLEPDSKLRDDRAADHGQQ
jgi:hypothetical protein